MTPLWEDNYYFNEDGTLNEEDCHRIFSKKFRAVKRIDDLLYFSEEMSIDSLYSLPQDSILNIVLR
jgi:hypothetical protein